MKTKIAIKYDPENWKEIKKAVDYLRGKGFEVKKRKDEDPSDLRWLSWSPSNDRFEYFEVIGHKENSIHLPQDWKKFKKLIEAELEPKPEFKAGDWVIYDKYVFRINKIESGIASSDDTIKCKWTLYIGTEYLRHATPEEIESALIKEAKRRGLFNAKINVKSIYGYDSIYETLGEESALYIKSAGRYILQVKTKSKSLECTLFADDKWAEIIQDEPDYKQGDWVRLKSGKIVRVNANESVKAETNVSVNEVERHATKDEIIEHLHERSKYYKANYLELKSKLKQILNEGN
jgi:hypothetical protein